MAVAVSGERRPRAFELTARDGQALEWIGQMYGARFDVLAVLLGRLSPETHGKPLSRSGVRKQVDRWKRGGLVRVERALGQSWVTLTRYGYDRVGQDYALWAVPVTRVRHCHAVNVVRIWYEGLPHPQGGRMAEVHPWTSERALFIERGKEGRWHLPDGTVEDPQTPRGRPIEHVAIEVQLTHKPRRWYQEEVFSKLRAGVERVQYFVPDEAFRGRVQSDISAALEALKARKPVDVRVLPDVEGITYDGLGW